MAYGPEIRQKARDLYVESGLSYEEVHRETGVSLNNLKKWGIKGQWNKQREEYQRAFESLRAKVSKGKILVMDAILDLYQQPGKFHSQDAYAHNDTLRSLNSFNNGNTSTSVDKAALFLEFLGRFAEHIKAKNPDQLRVFEPLIRSFAEEIKG
ncbi:MAG TPA: DUF1804 family protein [Candidatus Acidoferrales bacterium]|nr:DUF1804 family protein [Candidatus Acidoferrales bacterium]